MQHFKLIWVVSRTAHVMGLHVYLNSSDHFPISVAAMWALIQRHICSFWYSFWADVFWYLIQKRARNKAWVSSFYVCVYHILCVFVCVCVSVCVKDIHCVCVYFTLCSRRRLFSAWASSSIRSISSILATLDVLALHTNTHTYTKRHN